jgi:hypothetical protein
MEVYVYHRCGNCGKRTPGPGMERVHLKGKRLLICGPCYQELLEKRTGYRQAKLELTDEGGQNPDALPF